MIHRGAAIMQSISQNIPTIDTPYTIELQSVFVSSSFVLCSALVIVVMYVLSCYTRSSNWIFSLITLPITTLEYQYMAPVQQNSTESTGLPAIFIWSLSTLCRRWWAIIIITILPLSPFRFIFIYVSYLKPQSHFIQLAWLKFFAETLDHLQQSWWMTSSSRRR